MNCTGEPVPPLEKVGRCERQCSISFAGAALVKVRTVRQLEQSADMFPNSFGEQDELKQRAAFATANTAAGCWYIGTSHGVPPYQVRLGQAGAVLIAPRSAASASSSRGGRDDVKGTMPESRFTSRLAG